MKTLMRILSAILIAVLIAMLIPYILVVWLLGGFLIKGIIALAAVGFIAWELGTLIVDDKKFDNFSSEE